MGIVEITPDNFEKEVFESNVPVVLEFSAEWCGPCKMIAAELEALVAEAKGAVKVCTVDVDKNQELAVKYNVVSIPHLCFMHDGVIKASATGYMKKDEIVKRLESVVGSR